MREATSKKIEVIANLSVIAVAVLGCILLAKTLFPGDRSRTANSARASALMPVIGTKVSLPGVEWSAHKQTVVLVLSTKCRFCGESAPFFQRLAREIRGRGDTAMIAVFPQDPKEGSAYLESLGVPVDQVIQAPIPSVGARGTPTLILADDQGSIARAWVGRVPFEKEPELIGWLK